MSWHFSQALVAEYLEESSSAGAQSAPLNGTLTHGTFWSPDKTTDVSKLSRSGMTYKLLTADRGADLLTWCLEDSRVRTSAQPAKVSASRESGHPCGNTWQESSAKFDRNSLSWKTHQCLWEEDLPSSSLTLPNWGMMQSGVLWERITLPRLTSEIEFGLLLPTPTCADATMGAILNDKTKFITLKSGRLRKISNQGISGSIGLARTVAMWATPQSRDFRTGQRSRWENPERTRNLNDQIGGQLNPTWVEWLMGWPLGWTDCAASATDKFRQWQKSHGIY